MPETLADRLPLLTRALVDARRGLAGWGVAVLAVTVFYLSTYPSVGGAKSAALDSLPDSMRTAFDIQDLTSGAGYAQSTVVGLVGMVLLTVAAVAWAGRAVAGDEESGGLELVLAHGVSRTRVVLQRAAAALMVLLLAALVVLGIVAVDGPAGLGIGVGHAVAGGASLLALAWLHGSVALAVGAATGRRTTALVAGAAVALLGYVANSVGASVEGLSGLQDVAPQHWAYAAQPLSTGADWPHLALLLGVTAVLVLVAVLGLRRRDVGI